MYPIYEHYIRFILLSRNLIDLVTILPFWVTIWSGNGKGANFLRAFRLLRMVKLFSQFERAQIMLQHCIKTVQKALPALFVLFLLMLLSVILFSSILFILEQGTFTVTAKYPHGVYLRVPPNGVGKEISGYDSIPTCIYWAITTYTSGNMFDVIIRRSRFELTHCASFISPISPVGYGDVGPTSWLGRALTCVMFFSCTIFLAFPISIICVLFEYYYMKKMNSKWENANTALNMKGLTEVEMLELFDEMDGDGSGVGKHFFGFSASTFFPSFFIR